MTDAVTTSETVLPEAPSESLWKSYFKACVAGFAMGMTAFGLLSGGSLIEAIIGSVFDHIPIMVMMLTVAPALAIPIRVLDDVARLLHLPRGVSDIAIGAAVGSLMLLPDLTRGLPPNLMGVGFVIGGAFGGFVFWRGRGYPDREGRIRMLRTALDEAGDTIRARLGLG